MTRITPRHRQRQLFEMAELQRSRSDQSDQPTTAENVSYRSRASSVISTGTKFSISTMPQGHFNIDGVLEASLPRSTATRPTSLYSVRSMAPSLPPYEGHQPMDAIFSTNSRGGLSNVMQPSAQGEYPRSHPADSSDVEHPTTPSDPENTLSMHYGRVVRTIDQNHAHQLARIYQAHDQELAATRNAIDEAYRREFKVKNREIERIREEAANEIEQVRRDAAADVAAVQNQMEEKSAVHDDTMKHFQREHAEWVFVLHQERKAALEKARNAIEDVWEQRWNDRTKVSLEEAKRAAEEAKRREAARDSQWLSTIESMHPEIVDAIRFAMELSK